jgi:hypothetical protein
MAIGGTGLTEASIGLGAAAIIIDKVLNWTVKWKRTNGNGKLPLNKDPEWILHRVEQNEIKTCMGKIVETQLAQTLILQRMTDNDAVKIDLLKEIKGQHDWHQK